MTAKEMIGKQFGRLTVLDTEYRNRHSYCYCRCSCGVEKWIRADGIYSGGVISCGCYIKELLAKSRPYRRKTNQYDLSGEYGIGYTSNGIEFYFDLDDYDKIKDYCWHTSHGYIVTQFSNSKKMVRMHNFITGVKMIDHKNRNRADNRRSNLREATDATNAMNKSPKSISGVTGVNLNNRKNRWVAHICINRKIIHLGAFKDINDAIKARLEGEAKYFGEFSPSIDLFEKYGVSLQEDKSNESLNI